MRTRHAALTSFKGTQAVVVGDWSERLSHFANMDPRADEEEREDISYCYCFSFVDILDTVQSLKLKTAGDLDVCWSRDSRYRNCNENWGQPLVLIGIVVSIAV